MLWTKITIHTVNVYGSGYFHIGGGNDIVDLFLFSKLYVITWLSWDLQ